jgi:hypothetical protein
MRKKSNKLEVSKYRRPSFLIAIGSIINLSGKNRYYPQNGFSADAEALSGDWAMVGNDILKATNIYNAQNIKD